MTNDLRDDAALAMLPHVYAAARAEMSQVLQAVMKSVGKMTLEDANQLMNSAEMQALEAETAKQVGKKCYELADAFLAAREAMGDDHA